MLELDNKEYFFMGEKANAISFKEVRTGNVWEFAANADDTTKNRIYKNTTLSQGQNLSLLTGYTVSKVEADIAIYQRWGFDNKFVNHVINLVTRNPIAMGILSTMKDFICGQKIVLYKEVIRTDSLGKTSVVLDFIENDEITEYLEEIDFESQFARWTFDALLTGNYGVEFVRSNNNKIAGLFHHDVSTMRAGKAEDGVIKEYILSDWIYNNYYDGVYLPAYDKTKKDARFFYHGKNYFTGAYYYGVPTWIGSENFLRLLNEIPVFHLSGIRNGFGLRWHIKIPKNYFDSYTTQQEKQEAFTKLKTEMNNWLAGAENNGKTLVTQYDMNSMGVAREKGVIVEPLKPELLDTAYKNIYDQANLSVASAFGLNPELAGIIMQGSMSGNSGDGIRNAYNLFENTKAAQFRKWLLAPYKILQNENGWDKKIKLGIISHNLEKLNSNPIGQTPQLQGQRI